MMISMLDWMVAIGRFDVTFGTSSLSRFLACPRKGQLKRLLQVFGYFKKFSNRTVRIDSRYPDFTGSEEALDRDLVNEFVSEYPDAVEELDTKLHSPSALELSITGLVDSDHVHAKVTRRSITGLFIVIGHTPIMPLSKRQGAVETSTYGAEFNAMKTAVEEIQSIRCMLRCLGVHMTRLYCVWRQ